ncbi:hypothetical protein AGLY_000154, partial [Aphis glycines]
VGTRDTNIEFELTRLSNDGTSITRTSISRIFDNSKECVDSCLKIYIYRILSVSRIFDDSIVFSPPADSNYRGSTVLASFQNGYLNNFSSIYDLYFLSINKYLKSFEYKLLSLRDFVKILNLDAHNIFSYSFKGKLSVAIFNLRYKYKKCYEFSTTKLIASFRVFDIFLFLSTQHFLSAFKKKRCLEKSKISVVYKQLKKNHNILKI